MRDSLSKMMQGIRAAAQSRKREKEKREIERQEPSVEKRFEAGVRMGAKLAEDFWQEQFQRVPCLRNSGKKFIPAQVVLFLGSTTTADGKEIRHDAQLNGKIYVDPHRNAKLMESSLFKHAELLGVLRVFHEYAHHIQEILALIPSEYLRKVGTKETKTPFHEDQADYLSGVLMGAMQGTKMRPLESSELEAIENELLLQGADVFKLEDLRVSSLHRGGFPTVNFSADENTRSRAGHGVSFVRANLFERGFAERDVARAFTEFTNTDADGQNSQKTA